MPHSTMPGSPLPRLKGTVRRATSVLAGMALLASVLLGASGCKVQLIPNTDVEDTPDNRGIIEFCEAYRTAVERRDVQRLVQLADVDYYEDGGTLDSSDDIDISGLREYLSNQFVQATGIRYDIRYRRVTRGPKDHVYVDYTFSSSYKVPTDEGELWQRKVGENRLELVPKQDGYRVLAGM